MQDKPHTPEPLTSNDPYPPAPEADPMAERRRNSRRFYDEVDAAIAARPKAPSYITRSTVDEHTATITVDDGHGTAIVLDTADLGRLGITLTADGVTATASLDLFTVGVLRTLLHKLTDADRVAPITGSR